MGETHATPPASLPRRTLLVGSLLAVTLHAFDEMAVVTVLPLIAEELGGRSLYGAVYFAYLLVSLVGLVVGGGRATRRGPASAFALGLVSFGLGLLVGALAPSMELVVAGRALQGFGGGVLSATVLVVVSRGFTADERPRVMALNASAWVVPALVAPAAAGAIAGWASWRWVFGGLLPLVVLAGVLGIPAMRALGAGRAEPGRGQELLDGLRIAVGLGVALLALSRPFGPLEGSLVAGGALLAFAPLRRVLPEGVLRARPVLPAAVAFKGMAVFAFFGTEAFVPLALIEIHGAAPVVAGLALTGAALAWTAGAQLQARLSKRFPVRRAGAVGVALVAAGVLLVLPLLDPSTPLALAYLAWALAGLGMGIAYNTATVAAMGDTPEGSEGTTSTALGMVDALAISLATGLGGAWLAAAERAGAEPGEPLAPIWAAAAAVALLALLAARRLAPASVPSVPCTVPEGVAEPTRPLPSPPG